MSEAPDNALVATLLQLAADNQDRAVADELRRVAVLAQQHPDMPSSSAMQRAIWTAEDAVYGKLDKILAVCEGNASVVTEAFSKSVENELAQRDIALRLEAALSAFTGAMQNQEAAVTGLRAEFQPIAEGLSGLSVTVGEHTEQIDWLASMARTQEGRITDVIVQVDRHEVRLAEGELDRLSLTKRVQALESTIEQLRAHLGELTTHA